MCYKYPGPRCSNHALKELVKAQSKYALALESGDNDSIWVALDELTEAENNYHMTPKGQTELKAQIENGEDVNGELSYKLEYGQTARKAAIKAAKVADKGDVNTEHADGPVVTPFTLTAREPVEYNPLGVNSPEYQALKAELDERTNSPEFLALLDERDRKREAKKKLHEQLTNLKEEIDRDEKRAEGRTPYPGAGKPTEEEEIAAQDRLDDSYDRLVQLNSDHLDAYYEYHIANDALEQYKNETALVVADMNVIAGDPGIDYTGTTLGDCVEVASYSSGTREWLEERQNGIGGSDIGSILKLNPEHGQSNYNEFIKSKVEKYSQEEVDAQAEANSGFSGPTGRGNAWETAIVREYMDNNPDQAVMYSKASWANKDSPHHKANVDGLLSSDGKNPDGILEIKTASDISKWEKVNADGSVEELVPVEYRAQVLWYMKQTGFKYADIAAKVDDRKFVQRRIYADEPINPYDRDEDGGPAVGSLAQNMGKIEKVWKEEVLGRRDGTRTGPALKSTFDKAADADNINHHAVQLASWREISISEAKTILKGNRTKARGILRSGEHPEDSEYSPMHNLMVEEYRKGGPTTWTKDLVSVDIETSGMGPNSGEIIEIGIRRTKPSGEIVEEYSERFGIRNEKALDIVGTGAQDVHKIAPDDIRGKRNFTHPDVQAKVKKMIMDENAVVVAHNKAFEERWFDQYVPGFRKQRARLLSARFRAERAGESYPEPKPIMDTMYHARYLNHESKNNKLAQFTESNGIPYVDAHSALPDAQMTQRAIFNHDRKLRGERIIDERKPVKKNTKKK